MPRKKDQRINVEPKGGSFMYVPKAKVKPKKGPTKLLLRGKPCGCTFRYDKNGGTFKLKCEFHIAQREAIRARRLKCNSQTQILWPVHPKPKKKAKLNVDSPEVVEAVRAEIARRTKILRVEREKIKKPTKKLNKKERAHLHTFAFTAEQVRKEMLDKLAGAV